MSFIIKTIKIYIKSGIYSIEDFIERNNIVLFIIKNELLFINAEVNIKIN